MLGIPEAAAGKLVKCSCGKQLRAPGGTQKPAAKAGAPKAPAKPVAAKPVAAAKPAPTRAPAAAPQLDDDLFGELTDKDLTPVKGVYSPGQKAVVAGGPGDEVVKKSNKKMIIIIVVAVLLLAGIGVGVAGYLLGWFGGSNAAAAMIVARAGF
ncbi:hypothetical protein K239x_42340 [Planctomycetes bacterium K23_9]|uniref:Uncharacterized protein n=1 Tax=Stieleria marina TaxID=1930275 RepID=A0A517NYN4_9BACT|nr:hypothetical protein K239x_42340 [Planctomycetes bacterium K23_9]